MSGERLRVSAAEQIPLVDLKAQYAEIRSEVDAAVGRVIANADFILGKDVEEFEAEYTRYCEAAHCVALDSGLSALELGMRALGIGPGDEVITPAHSFIASSSAISFTGATPVWVDSDPQTYNIDPKLIKAAITPRTKAIMPVHLYGQPADMEPIMEIARRHKLLVVEDACQAHGARYRGRRVGTIGDIAAFSFYPGKNLGAYGDAGALVTNNAEVAKTVHDMRNYGQRKKYEHAFLAWNRRMDTLQAAILRAKLPHLEAWNTARRRHASAYDELLAGSGLGLPHTAPGVEHVFHLYVVQSERRDALLAHLADGGVHGGIHYPVPIHLQEAYRPAGKGAGSFPVAEAVTPRVLSLPMYPELGEDQLQRVADAVASFSAASKARA
jgi:dTDP-4-amino-4,6-dideoxygalactose transaminase